MEEIQNTQRLLLRRVAMATGAGLLAVVAGVGMTPAGAEDVSVKAEAGVEAEASPEQVTNFIITTDGPAPSASFDKAVDDLGVEAEAGVEAHPMT